MTDSVKSLLTDLLVDRVLRVVDNRGPGHCIRVDDTPLGVAQTCCETLQESLRPPHLAVVVRKSPTEDFERTPTQVVELRNRSDHDHSEIGVLVVFVPPQERLSVEDSIGASTFERLRADDLGERAWVAVLERINEESPGTADAVARVGELLLADPLRYETDHVGLAAFALQAAELVASGSIKEPEIAAGVALSEVGLLPDRNLLAGDEAEARRRLQLNGQQMDTLSEPIDPSDRIRQLPIEPAASPELIEALRSAVASGTTDRQQIAKVLAENSHTTDLSNWEGIGQGVLLPDSFRILKIRGDFEMEGGEHVVVKEAATIGVEFEVRPPADNFPEASLRLDVLRLDETGRNAEDAGVSVVKSKGLPKQAKARITKKFTFGDRENELPGPNIYQFRLTLRAHDGTTLGEDVSEHFRVGDIETSTPELDTVESVLEATVRSAAKFRQRPVPPARRATVDGSERVISSLEMRFADQPGKWTIEVPSRLADLEAAILEEPRAIRGFRLELGTTEPEYEVIAFEAAEGSPFLDVRAELFERLQLMDQSIEIEGGESLRPSLVMADLAKNRDAVVQYVETWIAELESTSGARHRELLETDRLTVTDHQDATFVALAPTHPLRLAWQLTFLDAGRDWIADTDSLDDEELACEAADLSLALPGVIGDELPLVVTEHHHRLRYHGALPCRWALWAREAVSDRQRLERELFRWLELNPRVLRQSGEVEILNRVRAYLHSHPYVHTLVLNIVRPGSAEFMLRTLGHLALGDNELRYVVRLFGDAVDPSLGSALDDFMVDPDGGPINRNAAEVLTRVRGDSLRPTVAFSKHPLDDLRRHPERFPAHISVFLDYFDLDILAVPRPATGRSVFGGGLLTGSKSSFEEAGSAASSYPRWITTAEADRSEPSLVDQALHAHQLSTAAVLGPAGSEMTPALRLGLDVRAESLMSAVHDSSDWVIIVDPVFSDEYLGDIARVGEAEQRERFVVDSRNSRASGELRNVVVSSKLRREQASLLANAATDLGFELDDSGRSVLLRGLHLLGAGLGLRMLADGTRRTEALSLSLASAFLAQQGFLRHGLVIPLDEYIEVFTEAQTLGEITSLSRTDLLIVRLKPETRTIATTLVEVKVRSGLGSEGGFPVNLADEIVSQLHNTEVVVKNRLFGAHLRRRPNSLPAAIRTRRLAGILGRHLDRSHRLGLLATNEILALNHFIDTLDQGFTVSVDLRGLVFAANAGEMYTQRVSGVDIDVVGHGQVARLLANTDQLPTVIDSEGAYLRTVFGAPAERIEVIPTYLPANEEERTIEPTSDDASTLKPVEGLELDDIELIGHASTSDQFAAVGNVVGREPFAALDLGGTNVVSVFGVQGSGKSYTVGSIIEGSLLPVPGLGRLPEPLATVVFHYSGDATYVSEFATLGTPNDDPAAVTWLSRRGILPASVDDIVVLATARELEHRRAEYGNVPVEALMMSPSELTLADWKLLMGVEGGKQMYAKALAQVLRNLGDDFTTDDLRAGIEDTDLSRSQKGIAKARVDFVDEYLDANARITDWVRPGRLVIVDARDSLIDREEALSLFMVLLNRFAEVRASGGGRFNKMIVFDEAHKYMSNTALTGAITEAVREMRHKGVTLVIASQDPPSVPAVVIELSTVIIAHRMTAPTWLKSLQRSNQAFSGVKPGELAGLKPGQALLWCVGGSNQFRQPQRLSTRPRLTKHGGETLRVGG